MAASRNAGESRRDEIARTALRILDDHGLADLTMRRLAAALDVQPSALYWHFENKQTLIADLADRIVERRPTVPTEADSADGAGQDWADRLRGEAAAFRDALLSYRDGADVVASTYALGLGSGRTLARFTDAVAAGGFDESTSRRAAAALLHFVLGHVSHEQQRLQYDSLGILADLPDALGEEGAEAFAFGVGLLVNGLARSHERPGIRGTA